MSFIGDFSLKSIRLNFQRQLKKKVFDVSLSVGSFGIAFLISGVCRTAKRHFHS